MEALLGACLVTALVAGLAVAQSLPRADTVVKPLAFVSLDPVPQGRAFEIAVVAEIQRGFHINANKVLEDYLIPTMVKAEVPAGLRIVETIYPQGKRQKFEFSENEMAVYDGSITILLKLQAERTAPMGDVKIPMTLRYQACNDVACLPPVNKAVIAELKIAPAGTRAAPLHPNVFKKN